MGNVARNLDHHMLEVISGISSLQLTDAALLQKSFARDTIYYSKSFLYILRASHGDNGSLGYKYISHDLVAVLGYRNNIIYLTPIKDETKGERLQQLCQEIVRQIHCRVILKKFSKDTYPLMKNKHTNISEYEREDDAYPEKLLRLSSLFTPQGEINPRAKQFNRKVKRFEKLGITFDIVENITHIPKQQIEQFLKMTPEKFANYLPMITYLYAHGKDSRYKMMVFLHKNIVHGVYISDTLSQKEVGLYCSVGAKNNPGSTEWMDWYFFRNLFFEGIQTIYFGGAETKGVDCYIKKLLPDKPSYFVETVEYIDNL